MGYLMLAAGPSQYWQCCTLWIRQLQLWKAAGAPVYRTVMEHGYLLNEEPCEMLFGSLGSSTNPSLLHKDVRRRWIVLNHASEMAYAWEATSKGERGPAARVQRRKIVVSSNDPLLVKVRACLWTMLRELTSGRYAAPEQTTTVKAFPPSAGAVTADVAGNPERNYSRGRHQEVADRMNTVKAVLLRNHGKYRAQVHDNAPGLESPLPTYV
jgi:hypothetical protein